MRPSVLVTEAIDPAGLELLQEHCDCITPWQGKGQVSERMLRQLLPRAQGVIVRLFEIQGEDLARSPELRVIGKHGVGVDNIDLQAARARQVQIVFTPEANAEAVAEHAVALLLALARRLDAALGAVRESRFLERDRYQGCELRGRTLGILGLGRVGSRVSEIARDGFGMKILAFDPYLSTRLEGIEMAESLESVLGRCDFLTLHLPLSEETRYLLNCTSLSLCKAGCRIVNTARGGLIEEKALIEALEKGQLGGAALDVFEAEPLPPDHPFCSTPNLLLTPHISSSTEESLRRMSLDVAEGVLDVLQGRDPRFPVPS